MCKIRIDEDYYLEEYFEGRGRRKKKKFRKSLFGTVYLSEISAEIAISEASSEFLIYEN